jgi:hypothetical protein
MKDLMKEVFLKKDSFYTMRLTFPYMNVPLFYE